MKLGDVYINKNTKDIIQISCFARHMNKWDDGFLIIYENVFNNGGMIGTSPSDCGYAKSPSEIEDEYELLVPQSELPKYETWEEVFEIRDKKGE